MVGVGVDTHQDGHVLPGDGEGGGGSAQHFVDELHGGAGDRPFPDQSLLDRDGGRRWRGDHPSGSPAAELGLAAPGKHQPQAARQECASSGQSSQQPRRRIRGRRDVVGRLCRD